MQLSSVDRHRHNMLLCGLIAIALIATVSAGAHTPFFADMMSTSKTATVGTAANYNYDYGYAETEHACIQQLNFKNCRCHS